MPTASERITHREPWRLPAWLGLCLFLAIAAFFLWEEHRAHLLGALPYVLLLLCPVIHLFMHRGHGGRQHSECGVSDLRVPQDVPVLSEVRLKELHDMSHGNGRPRRRWIVLRPVAKRHHSHGMPPWGDGIAPRQQLLCQLADVLGRTAAEALIEKWGVDAQGSPEPGTQQWKRGRVRAGISRGEDVRPRRTV